MALFTGKGDDGTTKTIGQKERSPKSSPVAEALGNLDEVNSFLGIVKVKAYESGLDLEGRKFGDIVHWLQQCLFSIQAELAGADKRVGRTKVEESETIINAAEKLMPPITSFFISGGTDLAAHFDVARTMARRAERRVVAVKNEGFKDIDPDTLAFLNRLSSVLYALARLTNHKSGIKEEPPSYQ